MAFTYTRIGQRVLDAGYIIETYYYVSSSGSTGGSITTKLNRVLFAKITEKDTAAMANMASVNTTLPSGAAVTIVTTANKAGYIWFFGK